MAEEFGKRIEAFGQNIWKKAQGAVNIVGMNNDISAKSRVLTDLYAEIGKAYCGKHRGDAETEFPELCEKAHALAAEIAGLQEEIQLQKGFRKCVACGALAPAQATFCPACGAAMPRPEPEPESDPVADKSVCRQCGAHMVESDVFCAACGARREEADAEPRTQG